MWRLTYTFENIRIKLGLQLTNISIINISDSYYFDKLSIKCQKVVKKSPSQVQRVQCYICKLFVLSDQQLKLQKFKNLNDKKERKAASSHVWEAGDDFN